MTVSTPASPSLLDDGAATFSATGFGQVSGAAAVVNLGALSAWNGAAVLNVASVKTSAGNETYLLNIQGATASSFASPQTLGSVQVSVAGQYLIPVTAFFGGVFYPYLRLQLVLSGTAPSIKMAPVSGTTGGCFALPFSGFSTASTADLTTLFGIAAQNLQQLSASLVAWANGTATGGPNGNGDYPIYDASGASTLAPSFAAYAATVKQGATGPAGPAGPTGPAGTTSYTGLANIPTALTLDANGRLEGTNIAVTPGGATLASLVPAQAGADVTGQHIAAGVIGQGPFATGTAYSLLTGIPNALLLNAAELLEASSMAYGPGVLVSALQPAQANADVTAQNTAAAFLGQSPWATFTTYTPTQVTQVGNNLLANGDCTRGTDNWTKAGSGTLNGSSYGGPSNQAYISAVVNGIWYNDTPVTAGQPYSFQGWVSALGLSAGYVRIIIEWMNSAKTSVISSTTVAACAAGTNWTQYTLPNQTAPSGAAYGRILIDTANTSGTEQAATFNTSGNVVVGWAQMKMEQGAACTPMSAQSTTSALYSNGTSINALQPAQANADQTSLNTAAGFTGQGALATLSSLGLYGGQIIGLPAAIASANLVGGAYISGNYLYNPSSGQSIQTYWPATTAADKTGNATAAAVAGQSAWATYSGFSPGQTFAQGANLINNGGFNQQLNTWTDTSSLGVYGSGQNGVNATPFAYTNSTAADQLQSKAISVIPNYPYSLQGYMYTAGMSSGHGQISLAFYNSAGTYLTETDLVVNAGCNWSYVTAANIIAPSAAAYAYIYCRTTNAANSAIGGSVWNGAATLCAWGQIKLETGAVCTPFNTWGDTSALYWNNATLDSLQPAQISADRTAANTAAAIAGQGSFATISVLSTMSQMPYNMQQAQGFVYSAAATMTCYNGVMTIQSNTLYMTGGGTISMGSASVSCLENNAYCAVFYDTWTATYVVVQSGTSGYYTSSQRYVAAGTPLQPSAGATTGSSGGNTSRGNVCIP